MTKRYYKKEMGHVTLENELYSHFSGINLAPTDYEALLPSYNLESHELQ